jgi:hypothetical protein
MARLGPALTLATGGIVTVTLGVLTAVAAPAGDGTGAEVATGRDAEVTTQASPAPSTSAPSTSAPSSPGPETPDATETARPAPARVDYAGRIKGNRGLIAVSVRNGKAIAYFCDGKTEAWFKGRAAGDEVTLEGFGGATVAARIGGGRAAGKLELGGKEWDFAAPTVRKPSGLYRASAIIRGASLKAGWIVLPDGTQVGLAKRDEQPIPTPTLTPGTDPAIDGTRVTAEGVDEFIEDLS